MPTKIGPFEILNELSKSPTGAIYKANDPESGQTIALKAIQLSAFGESAAELQQALLAEAESSKVLSSPNITNVYGAGEIEGQFCAAMEYVQGNSIANMLARKEGFSIWDLLDIGRQLTAGFDHAKSHNIVHYSLEPSKIMCGWDGTVKILGFGVSSVGKFAHHIQEGLPPILHYLSPEQVQGQPTDARSNLFSLGAMFYEMVTERKAFDRDDIESLRQSIVESTPTPPIHVNPKVHPGLSDLIMKALAKDPAERYQTGREMLDDLEKCKESKTLAAKKPEAKAAAPAKTSVPAASKPAAAASRPASPPASRPVEAKSGLAIPAEKKITPPAAVAQAPAKLARPSSLAAPKAAAAAAGMGGNVSSSREMEASSAEIPEIDLSNQFITSCVKATLNASDKPTASMSSAVADEVEAPQVETFEPQSASSKIAVDPMMAEGGRKGSGGVSFSEMTELPPLKEAYVPPPPPPSTSSYQPVNSGPAPVTMFQGGSPQDEEEKPRVQPREVAAKAIKEIKGVPPKLMLYALSGAGILILLIGLGVTFYVHSLNSDDDPGAKRAAAAAAAETAAQPEAAEPAPKKSAAPVPVVAQGPGRYLRARSSGARSCQPQGSQRTQQEASSCGRSPRDSGATRH